MRMEQENNLITQVVVERLSIRYPLVFFFCEEKDQFEINLFIQESANRGYFIDSIHWKLPEQKLQTIVFWFAGKQAAEDYKKERDQICV